MKHTSSTATARARRTKDQAREAARKTRNVALVIGAGIVSAFLFLGGIVPFLFGGILDGLGVVAMAFGGGVAALAAWFRSSSDDKGERLLWFGLIVVGIGALLFSWAGV